MIQHCAACLPHSEALDEATLPATGKAVGQQGRTLGTLFSGCSKPEQMLYWSQVPELGRKGSSYFHLSRLPPR